MAINIGIDLGTANIVIYSKRGGIIIDEPSIIAIDNEDRVIAIGEQARLMLGRTHNNIKTIKPLDKGVISDFIMTETILDYYLKKVLGKNYFNKKPNIAICVPSGVTSVEKHSVKDVAKQIGARHVYVIEEPVAAAIGAGIDISKPVGTMVLDIGGGTTDCAVISYGDTVISKSIKIAGDSLNEAIVRYIRHTKKILIGINTAELIKIYIGTVIKDDNKKFLEVRGRDLASGLPKNIVLSSEDIREVLVERVENMFMLCKEVLEITPPELVSDIYERGLILTGGGSMIGGIDKYFSKKLNVTAIVAESAIHCVAIGTGKYINYIINKNNKKIF